MGGLVVDKVVHGHQGWRLISCIWLHGGVIHLLANMLCLLLIGIRLEQEFGFGMQRNHTLELLLIQIVDHFYKHLLRLLSQNKHLLQVDTGGALTNV